MILFIQKTYLSTIQNSLGTKLFQHFYVEKEDQTIDVLEGGALSCAYFVSSILKLFNRIPEIHTTVKGTVSAMEESNWSTVALSQLKKGDVLVWDEIEYEDASRHGHIGFYIGKQRAISHSSSKKVPLDHHFTFNGQRAIIKALRFNSFKV